MRHFATEEWIDFVNRTATTEQHQAMQEHLGSGCKKCSQELVVWERVREMAGKENAFRPPQQTVDVVKASYTRPYATGRKKQSKSSLVEVLFDSFLQPAMAGTRSSATGNRQMLYRAGPYQIDVQVELKPESNVVLVAGQILNASASSFVDRRIPVTLSNLQGHVIYMATNQFGEFSSEIKNSGDLLLHIAAPGEEPITISLRNALDSSTGEKP